jgi:hypothetical protein
VTDNRQLSSTGWVSLGLSALILGRALENARIPAHAIAQTTDRFNGLRPALATCGLWYLRPGGR